MPALHEAEETQLNTVSILNVETTLKDESCGARKQPCVVEIEFDPANIIEEPPERRVQQGNREVKTPNRSSSFFFDRDWLPSVSGKEGDFDFLKLLPTDEDSSADGASVSSASYYDAADFKTSNWMKAMDAPTFGLAAIAITAALAHPILLAGALTAFCTATAVGAAYEYVVEGPLGKWFCMTSTTVAKEEEQEKSSTKKEIVEKEHDDEGTEESSQSAEPAEPIEEISLPTTKHVDLTCGSTVLTPEQDLSEKWLYFFYPPLENTIVKDQEFVGLNVIQFFQVFFADRAPYNFMECQKKRGDIDIEYGPWKDLPGEGPLSMHPEAPTDFPRDVEYYSHQGRYLSFKAKTNSFFGPPYASTTKTQTILIASKKRAVLESKTVLADIPFCDRFFVMERWTIVAEKVNHHYKTQVSATCQVFFTRQCPFDSQIRAKSRQTVTDITKAWCAMVKEALKLTEQAKLNRLRQLHNAEDVIHNEKEDNTEPARQQLRTNEGVEVQQSRGGSFIVDEKKCFSRCDSEPCEPRRSPRRSLLGIKRSLSQILYSRRQSGLPKGQAEI